MKRLAVDIDHGLHRAIRTGAVERGRLVAHELREVLAALYAPAPKPTPDLACALTVGEASAVAAVLRDHIAARRHLVTGDPAADAITLRDTRNALRAIERALAERPPTRARRP